MFVPKMKFVGSVEFEIWTLVWRKLKWRHQPLYFYEILIQIFKGHILAVYPISVWSNIWELRYTVGKLKNYEEKMDIEPLWPKFTKVHQSAVSNNLAKKPRPNRCICWAENLFTSRKHQIIFSYIIQCTSYSKIYLGSGKWFARFIWFD